MLFKETVEKDTLSILDMLQKDDFLSNFYLVGGTALALIIEIDRAILSLTYFSDIDFTIKINLIDAIYSFKPISERLHNMKLYPDKIFSDFPIKMY
jgi:hypothetical protein